MPIPDEAMSTNDPVICSKCGIRTATNYICFGGTGQSLELCDECLPDEAPLSAAFIGEARTATCCYCGGSPCCGGIDSFAQMVGLPAGNRWMCMSCSTEYHAFMQRAFEIDSTPLAHADQIEEIKKIVEAAEVYMSAFARQSDN